MANQSEKINAWAKRILAEGVIEKELYDLYKVNRGLRDLNGKGVLTGLTEISEVNAKREVRGELVPCEGELYYRGYNVYDLVDGFTGERRAGFEETCYLLLFGALPTQSELDEFKKTLSALRPLPQNFVQDFIMKSPTKDVMNSMARSVLTLYSADETAERTDIPSVLMQCLSIIAKMPQLALCGYQVSEYFHQGAEQLILHEPDPNLSTAENILHMLRKDSKYTPLEAELLDLALVLHAEHGGGNNSSFTMHVVTSSGTDTYSAFAASIGSLKGPKHGGANVKVCAMMDDLKKNVSDITDEEQVKQYLIKLINKEAFDKSGLVYGIGHAIYSLSDPRAVILKHFARELAHEKGMEKEFYLHETVARLAPELIAQKRKMYKGVSPNVDFYSGFVYRMLGLPDALFTPLFAVARTAGWAAHRLEEIINGNKIIRPAYMAVLPKREYKTMPNREKEE